MGTCPFPSMARRLFHLSTHPRCFKAAKSTRFTGAAAAMAAPTENPVPVWMDGDPGHDDAFAIIMAAGEAEKGNAKLLGVSTAMGSNTPSV